MNRPIKQRWQSSLWGTFTVVLMLSATIPAFTQNAGYKVGDHAEIMLAGEWVKAEILEVKDNGEYTVRANGVSGIGASAKNLRSLKAEKADAPTSKRNTQTKTAGGTVTAPEKKSIGQRYGSREPRTCRDTKAPAKGAITAELARKYFICQAEGVWGGHLYLVENVRLEVGGGVPYHPTLGAFEAIDVRVPLYPIRGSYLRYQCKDLETEYVGPPGKNANTYNNPRATGYCYKTTFGDWRCSMADSTSHSKENFRTNAAPPKS